MRNLIVGFILGGGVGAGVTYLIMKRMYTRQMQEMKDQISQDEYNRARAYFESKDIELSEAEAARAEQLSEKMLAADRALNEYSAESEEEDAAEAESPSEYDEDDPEDQMNKEQNELIEKGEIEENIQEALEKSRPKCKILKPESFGEIDGYECETLKFYVKDHMLVHENGELVEDPEFLLDDALDRYGWADDDADEDALLVRNYALQRDYDVQKIMDEWHGNE